MPEKILLVEDDEFIRTWLDYELSEDGYQVTVANNGLDGLQAARQVHPDLILLDVMMPGMNGFDLARKLHGDPQTTGLPIIFLTARSSTEDKIRGLDSGAVNYLTKPFQIAELKANIKALLQHTRSVRQEGEAEVTEAAQIQRSLIPHELPETPCLELFAGYRSARQVSGDFYDLLVRPDGQLAFVVADISGKGLAAAMMMSSVRTAMRTALRELPTPEAVLAKVNQELYDDLTEVRKFVTLFVGFFNCETRQVTYANAGHSPVIFCEEPGTAHILEPDGPPLGVLPSMLSADQTLRLNPGDVLAITSDGLCEAEDPAGKLFGYDRLLRTISDLSPAGATALGDHLFDEVSVFAENRRQADDQTLVILRGKIDD
jgi:sigma-B regulation protein RsbU (phosphoserine phosphatase)